MLAHCIYDELGLRTMVTVHDGDAYTSAIANAFADAFREHGGAVPVVARVAKGQADMATVLAQFNEADPDGVFIPLFPTAARSLIHQAAELDALDGVTMIGGAATLTTGFLALPDLGRPLFHGTRVRRQRQHEPGDGQKLCRCTGRVRGRLWGGRQRRLTGRTGMTPRRCCSQPSSRFRPSMEIRSTSTVRHSVMRWMAPQTFRASSERLPAMTSGSGTGRSVIHLHDDSSVTDPSLLPIVYKGARDSHLPQQ